MIKTNQEHSDHLNTDLVKYNAALKKHEHLFYTPLI